MRNLRCLALACALGCAAIVTFPLSTVAEDQGNAGARQKRAWRMLRKLVGQWHASADGRDVRTEYRFIANGKYLAAETVSVSSSEQGVHTDLEVFSYDAANNRVKVRQFVSEGVICRYTLDEISPDGKILTFLTDHCEGASPAFGARWIHGFPSSNEYTTKLELSPNGKSYMAPCVDSRLRRVE